MRIRTIENKWWTKIVTGCLEIVVSFLKRSISEKDIRTKVPTSTTLSYYGLKIEMIAMLNTQSCLKLWTNF
jgi:hypothetical protein